MDWVHRAKREFNITKPQVFTNIEHCEECAEHNDTLSKNTVDSIGFDELGNPAWDPISFCNVQGKLYYMPAFIRLSLETLSSNSSHDCYFTQWLFHLEYDGINNDLFLACNTAQRRFIADFIAYIIDLHTPAIERNMLSDEVLTVYAIWSQNHSY